MSCSFCLMTLMSSSELRSASCGRGFEEFTQRSGVSGWMMPLGRLSSAVGSGSSIAGGGGDGGGVVC